MCGAAGNNDPRARERRGERRPLEAKAHAFRRGNLWENEEGRGKKEEEIRVMAKETCEFCFRLIRCHSLASCAKCISIFRQ